MPTAHATLFFCTAHFGWVEQFFRTDSNLELSLQAAVNLARARFAILGQGVNLYKVRVSQVGSPGASASWATSGLTLTTPAMEAHQGASIDLVAGVGGLYHREYMLRGLPRDALVQTGRVWRWSPALQGPAMAWLALLASQGWQLQCWGRAGPSYPILALAQSALINADCAGFPFDPAEADPDTTLVVATILGTPVPPPIDPTNGVAPSMRVGRVVWKPTPRGKDARVNGEYDPAYLAPGLVAWQGTLPPVGSYVRGGYVQLRPRLYLPIKSAQLGGLTVKATGGLRRDAVLPPLPGQEIAVTSPVVPPGFALTGLNLVLVNVVAGSGIPGPPIPPPPPVDRTLANMQELANYVWEGYTPVVPARSNSIGIARIVNLQDTWLVAVSGTDTTQSDQALGFPEDVAIALRKPNDFSETLKAAVLANVPPGGKIVYAGHSLGGMVVQELCAKGTAFPRQAVRLITFCAPLVYLPDSSVAVFRYALPLDVVVYASPWATGATALQTTLGVSFWVQTYSSLFAPFQTYLDPEPVPPSSYLRHTQFNTADILKTYGADGFPGQISAGEYQLGPTTRIPVNKIH